MAMAKSYYKVIDGEKYDRSLLEMAEKIVGKKKEGRISEKDAKKLFEDAGDGKGFTETEIRTLAYIPKNFTLSKSAEEFFQNELKNLTFSQVGEVIGSGEKKKGFPWWLIVLLLIILFLLLLFFWRSCSSPDQTVNNEPSSTEMQKLENMANETEEETAEVQNEVDDSLAQLKELVSATAVRFEKNKANVTSDSREALQKIAGLLKKNPALKLRVVGHTCKLGTEEVNARVSRNRADSVLNTLLRDGVDSSQLNAVGRGNQEPLNSGNTESELAQNRRVTFEVID